MSTYRTPFDFSVGGAISHNSTQIAQLRDRYQREERALAQQQAMSDTMRRQADERNRATFNVLKRQQAEQQIAAQRSEMLKEQQRQREKKREKELHQPLVRHDLLPFSSHYQRMPAPLMKPKPRSSYGAQTARGTFNHHSTGHPSYRHSGVNTRRDEWRPKNFIPRPDETYQVASADDFVPAPSEHDVKTVTDNSSHGQGRAPLPPPSQQYNLDPYSNFEQKHQRSSSLAPSRSAPMNGHLQPPNSNNRPDGYNLYANDPHVNPTPADGSVQPPFTRRELLAIGHKQVPHPFYANDTRLINREDQAYLDLLDQRYPKHLLPPNPAPLSEQTLPADYNLNGWSVQFGNGVKKCRETKIQEYMIAKRYL